MVHQCSKNFSSSWTSQTPTEPGIYWVKDDPLARDFWGIELVAVQKADDDSGLALIGLPFIQKCIILNDCCIGETNLDTLLSSIEGPPPLWLKVEIPIPRESS